MFSEQEGGKHTDNCSKEMTLIGNSGFLWKDRPYHSAIDKEDDHRKRNRQPVPAQYADGKYKKHHSMCQSAGTEVPALASE